MSAHRRIRVCYFNTWAEGVEEVAQYLARVGSIDLRPRIADPSDPALLRKARLDCDWYAENARCFGAMTHPDLTFSPAFVAGPSGLLDWAKVVAKLGEEVWLITMGHQPQALGQLAGKLFGLLRHSGVRICYYAFDEASRFMPCFRDIAPHLDVLIHDESPLDGVGAAALRSECRLIHRSWVANCLPFAAPFNENPAPTIHFLGSQLGLTDHRRRQLEHLQRHFKDRFVAVHDHSLDVADRFSLSRHQIGFCPEGRKFTTPAMSATHTDRPFWSGCLGMVPVSEDAKAGGRLDTLAASGLIVRYPHGDLKALVDCCERALAMPTEERRRIYEHFNRNETVGTVVADAMACVL